MTASNPHLGKYEIISELGKGGFATVYKARDTSWMARDVALKVLHPALMADASFVKRFQREAEVMGRLNHPNIATLYDVGESDGQIYLAMQFILGMNLREYMSKKGQLPLDQIASILQQIGAALDYAHAHNAIHRDVKPNNIIYDEEGHATLTDFGIARLAEGTTFYTTPGTVMGTPYYTSPEQADSKPMDGRSDLYSLGVTAYELCTGSIPFIADTTPSLYYKIVHEEAPLPSKVNPRVALPIEQVLLKAMAKKPDDRYQTGTEFATAFSAAVKETQGNYIKSLLNQAKADLAKNAYDATETKLQQVIAIDPTHAEAKGLLAVTAKRRDWTIQYREISASLTDLRKRAERLRGDDDGMADTQGVIELLTKGDRHPHEPHITMASTDTSRQHKPIQNKMLRLLTTILWTITFTGGIGMVAMGTIYIVNMSGSGPYYWVQAYQWAVGNLLLGLGLGTGTISGIKLLVKLIQISRQRNAKKQLTKAEKL